MPLRWLCRRPRAMIVGVRGLDHVSISTVDVDDPPGESRGQSLKLEVSAPGTTTAFVEVIELRAWKRSGIGEPWVFFAGGFRLAELQYILRHGE